MTDDKAFQAWPKIPRARELFMTITEKIDGTNAHILIPPDPAEPILAASRSRYVTPDRDNFGFARWVAENECSHRGCGARGPKHHDLTRACDLFCCPPQRTAGGMGGIDAGGAL